MNVENPNDFQEELIVTEVYDDKIYKLKEYYKNESLISIDTIRTSSNNNSVLLEKIQKLSDSFSQKDMSFGEINIADEGALGITIDFDNHKQIFWEIGFLDKNVDPRIKEIYNLYEEIEQKISN